jgi:hypothetical protein
MARVKLNSESEIEDYTDFTDYFRKFPSPFFYPMGATKTPLDAGRAGQD